MNERAPGVLPQVEPPHGGWERLLSRRERALPPRAALLAFASGVAAVSLGIVLERGGGASMPLPLPATAARLTGAPATGRVFVPIEGQLLAAPLPSEDENVKLYWVARDGGAGDR